MPGLAPGICVFSDCGLKNQTAKATIPPTTASITVAAASKPARPVRKSNGKPPAVASQ